MMTSILDTQNNAPIGIKIDRDFIPENAENGTVVGTLFGIDPDAGETFSYLIVGGFAGNFPESPFAIVGDKLIVADKTKLDYERFPSYQILVQVTDSQGATTVAPLEIQIQDVQENRAPVGLAIDNGIVVENAGAGTVVGTLFGIDPDAGDTFTYRLVSPPESPFSIVGDKLVVADGAKLDFERQSTYDILVEVKDAQGAISVAPLHINVADVLEVPENRTPTELILSGNTVAENAPNTSAIGYFMSVDPDGDPVSYQLVDDAYGRFALHDNMIIVKDGSKLDYETSKSHEIKVRVTDIHGASLEKVFTILVKDLYEEPSTDPVPSPENRAPTELILSGNTVAENAPNTSAIGYFMSVDPDGDPVSYQLVDDAYGRFALHDNMIIVKDGSKLDYETSKSHEIKVRVTDSHGASLEKVFAILVKDIDENPNQPPPGNQPPTGLVLETPFVYENPETGTLIGKLRGLDPDSGETFTYTLLNNSEGRFKIEGDRVIVADGSKIDFETAKTHEIKIKVTDSHGASIEVALPIYVRDVYEVPENPPENQAPQALNLTGNSVLENSPNTSAVGYLTSIDPDGDTVSYRLLDDADGRFVLHDNMIIVKDGTKLDYETAQSHNVTVRVTDAHGASLEKTFTIAVKDVDESIPNEDPIEDPSAGDVLVGGSSHDRLLGGDGDDTIFGGRGHDTLLGGNGDDVIAGGLNRDVLTGGRGEDSFVFNTKLSAGNVDRITDFSVTEDVFHLAKSVFKGIGKKGELAKSAFWTGEKAHDVNDRIIYDESTGSVYFDADGTGTKAAIKIAVLKPGLALSHDNFLVI